MLLLLLIFVVYMFSFQNNAAFVYLWVLPLLCILFFYFLKWRKGKLKLLGNFELIKNLLPAQSNNVTVRFMIWIACILLVIITLAGPRLGTSSVTEKNASKDIIFCLDISNSMNAQDVGSTRLEKAKLFLQQLIKENSKNQMGLVVFAGNAYISVPLTLDVDALNLNIQVLTTDAITAQGTNIGAALNSAHLMFNAKSNSGKSIVLITDGEDHEGDFAQILDECATENITINTIGIGNPQGTELLDLQTNTAMLDDNGQHIVSKLNEAILQQIATKTNGAYLQLNNNNGAVKKLTSAINNLGGSTIVENKFQVYNHYFQYALSPAIVLLILYLLFAFLPSRRTKFVGKTILFFALGLSTFFIASPKALAQEALATQSLKEGKALYKSQKYDAAINAFKKVFPLQNTTALQQFSAFFNTGNSYCKQQQWQAAIDNYKQSLALNPNSLIAKNNLVYAQKKLEQEKKQQQQKQKPQPQKPQSSPKADSNQAPKPKPQLQPSKLTEQQAKQLLDGLKQDEQKILKSKIGNNNPAQNKSRKDW